MVFTENLRKCTYERFKLWIFWWIWYLIESGWSGLLSKRHDHGQKNPPLGDRPRILHWSQVDLLYIFNFLQSFRHLCNLGSNPFSHALASLAMKPLLSMSSAKELGTLRELICGFVGGVTWWAWVEIGEIGEFGRHLTRMVLVLNLKDSLSRGVWAKYAWLFLATIPSSRMLILVACHGKREH